MNKNRNLYLSILAMLVGFGLNAMAWTILPGPTLNTMGLVIGLGLMFFGFVSFLINLHK